MNVYGLVHTMFRDALVDELIEQNPCMLHRGELPEKIDKDPEWRASTIDDLIVPTRNMTPVAPKDANEAFKRDLAALGLRVVVGAHRDRGGHDLRSWFITTCQEHGAHRDLLRVVTHTAKGDVVSGYARATWGALCAEVAKLRVAMLDGELLPLATGFATVELKRRIAGEK